MGKTILVFGLLHDPPAHAGKKRTTYKLCIRIRRPVYDTRSGKRSVFHLISWTRPSPSYAPHRFTCPLIRVHSPIIGSFIHCHGPAFLASTILSLTYCHCDSTGLETTLDIPRGDAHLAHLDRASSPGRSRAQARGRPRRALCIHSSSVLTAAPQRSARSSSLH